MTPDKEHVDVGQFQIGNTLFMAVRRRRSHFVWLLLSDGTIIGYIKKAGNRLEFHIFERFKTWARTDVRAQILDSVAIIYSRDLTRELST